MLAGARARDPARDAEATRLQGSGRLVGCFTEVEGEKNIAQKEYLAIRPAMSQQPDVYLEPKWLRLAWPRARETPRAINVTR